jgi:HAD superfamily hydrolase (TIGR01509 family)
MSQPKLIVFDLGRVMIRLCAGWADACHRADVPVPPNIDDASTREAIRKIGYLHEVGRLSDDDFATQTATIVGLTPTQVSAISHQWLDGPYPGWHELLNRLHALGLRTACLSNTNATHWRLMTTPGGRHHLPLDRLHYRIASHLAGAYKPEPAIYEALERESRVPPAAIVFFDDLEANCLGARARGWHAHVITHPGDPVTQITTHLRGHGLTV